jgi:SLIT-ROBO Rho GTPase activating protein
MQMSLIFNLHDFSVEVEAMEAVALFDYVGRTDKELSFKRNQTIFIYKKMNHEWWQGCLAGGNESGYVPDGYIKLRTRSVN